MKVINVSDDGKIVLNDDNSMTIYGTGHKLYWEILRLSRKTKQSDVEIFNQFYKELEGED